MSVTRSRQAPRRIAGSSASTGRVVTVSTAACTSSAARPMSHPGSNSSAMTATASRLVALLFSTPSIARSTGSSTWTTPASMSSGLAPSQVTETLTLSTTTSGKNCARICGAAAMPRISITTISRLAAVGWRVK